LREPETDIEPWVRRAQRGDLDAFEQVVRAYQCQIRAWLAAHSPPGADADEVAQKTFIIAFQGIAEYELGTSFKAWLYAIARYQLMGEATRIRRIADYHSRLAPEIISRELERFAEDETPESVIERLTALRACLGDLGERATQLLQWRYDDGIPLAEMAERSGRSVGAIKKNLFVLRRQLQECIECKLKTGEGRIDGQRSDGRTLERVPGRRTRRCRAGRVAQGVGHRSRPRCGVGRILPAPPLARFPFLR